MFYAKKLNEEGEVKMLISYDNEPVLTNSPAIEIDEEEYNTLHAELAAKWEEENPEQETEEFAGEQDYLDALALLGVE